MGAGRHLHEGSQRKSAAMKSIGLGALFVMSTKLFGVVLTVPVGILDQAASTNTLDAVEEQVPTPQRQPTFAFAPETEPELGTEGNRFQFTPSTSLSNGARITTNNRFQFTP